ncbi:MAG TPA: hypothetical protein VHL58_04545 [Thermoanaerobaculia bacterium]|nr:hypothetical protein [Thermoanaerobaculia bacterium]
MSSTTETPSGGGEAVELSDDEDFDGTEPEVMQGERNLGEFSSADDDSDY